MPNLIYSGCLFKSQYETTIQPFSHHHHGIIILERLVEEKYNVKIGICIIKKKNSSRIEGLELVSPN